MGLSANSVARTRFWDCFRALAIPLTAAVAVAVVLALPDQMREIYRIFLFRPTQQAVLQGFLAAAALIGLGLVLGLLARDLVRLRAAEAPTAPARLLSAWGPPLLAATPLLGAALGMMASLRPQQFSDRKYEALSAILSSYAELQHALFVAGVALMAAALFVMLALRFLLGEAQKTEAGPQRLPAYWHAAPPLFAAALLASWQFPSHWPHLVGALPLIAFWMGIVAVLAASLSQLFRPSGIPILGLLLAAFLLFDYLNWSDNHKIRHTPSDFARPTVEAYFRQWLDSRSDLAHYKERDQPYPIYIVAAEGGGLYAAYHAARFLARMQDLCPNFAQHVFALSGVSGGSLGIAVFAGLARERVRNTPAAACQPQYTARGPFEAAADNVLGQDFLSPVLAAGLFPDFLQRFLPYPIASFDRALALEAGFERAWGREAKGADNLFADTIFSFCGADLKRCMRGAAPLPVFNMIQIATGVQVALSPLDMSSVGPPWSKGGKIFDMFATGFEPVDMPLSTAVGLSARFPYVTPPGWFPVVDPVDKQRGKSQPIKIAFADGGYAEGSGVLTAYKLVQFLDELIQGMGASAPKVKIELLSISAVSIPFERFWMSPPEDRARRFGEITLPLVAAMSAQEGRAFTTAYDLIATAPGGNIAFAQAEVYFDLIPVALGWQLSQFSRDYIEVYNGRPQRCRQQETERSLESMTALAASYVARGDCLAAHIVQQLSPP